jgi:hypothetical protein
MLEKRAHRIDRNAAEMLAIQALQFIAGHPEELGRFLALSGIGPDQIRTAARDPQFLVGVLDFLLGDEPFLLSFAASSDTPAGAIGDARRLLGG